jgi:pyrroloquinoline quinone biosynthesis protein D
MALTPTSVPSLWRFARVQFDDVRQQHVLQYPEGVMLLNPTGAEILELCDGERTIDAIARILGERYECDVVADVVEYLSELADRSLIRA